MRIIKTNNMYLLKFDYKSEYVDRCRIVACNVSKGSFKYDPDRKGWRILPEVMHLVIEAFPEATIIEDIKDEVLIHIIKQSEKSRKIIESKKIELNTKLPLMEFQKKGANYIVTCNKCMNNDDMGLGKTIQTLAAIHFLGVTEVLIVVPAYLTENWKREAKKWINRETHLFKNQMRNGTNIISYEKLTKYYDPKRKAFDETIPKLWEMIVFDEAHYLKSGKALRTKAAITLSNFSDRVVLLTGTPIVNYPKELITQLKIINALKDFGGEWNFLQRYCNPKKTYFGWDFTGSSNLDELSEKLKPYCIRRFKKDVLVDFPEKTITTTYLTMLEPKKYKDIKNIVKQEILDCDRQFSDFYKSLAGLKPEERNKRIIESKLDGRFKSLSAVALTVTEKLRQEIARQKVQVIKDKLEQLVTSKIKTVVFCVHRQTVRDIYNMLPGNSVWVTGEIKTQDRMKAVDEFENNENTILFIATLKTASLGYNLTVSSNMEVIEFDWTPSIHKQAEDRIYRIKQENHCTINYNVLTDTIDKDIAELIQGKSEVINQSVGGEILNILFINE